MSFAHSSDAYGAGPGYQAGDGNEEFVHNYNIILKSIESLKGRYNNIKAAAEKLGGVSDSQRFRDQLGDMVRNTKEDFAKLELGAKRLKENISTSGNYQKNKAKADDMWNKVKKFQNIFNQLAVMTKATMEETVIPRGGGSRAGFEPYTDLEDPYQDEIFTRDQQATRANDDRKFQDILIAERDDEIRAIQGNMYDLNDVFKQLSTMVEDQGEMVDSIQSNISVAADHVDTAVDEINEASDLQSSARKKYIIIAIVVAVLAAIGIVVVIISTGKKKN